MPNFWKVVNEVISKSDMVLLVLDARIPDLTRHQEIEQKIARSGKQLLFVLNKADLIPQKRAEQLKHIYIPSIFLSAVKHQGTALVRDAIMAMRKGEKTTVGVLGYPNVGKSSVINALAGGGKAAVGNRPGFTRGLQLIRVSQKMYLLDTPGVFPAGEMDEVKHLLIGSKDPHKAKQPDVGAAHLLELNREKIPSWYGLDAKAIEHADGFELLSLVAEAYNLVQKGGIPDTSRAAIRVLMDWQKGKII